MYLKHLRIENLRLIERLALDLSPGWNLFVGGNGAGKTTLLEAAFLLSHGRSFRTGVRDVLPRHGGQGYSVYAELAGGDVPMRVGIARSGQRLEARIDGETVPAADLMRHAAVLCFEPGSHELISAGSEERRRFIDWGVFHVEHSFLGEWRRYQRALKQRNALLRRNGGGGAELDTWDHELAAAALPLTAMRQTYFDRLQPIMSSLLQQLLGELGTPRLAFQPGFDVDRSLEDTLFAQRERDLARGHTGTGPHRAGWSLVFEGATRREYLSRGQEKLCAFAAVLSQAMLFAEQAGIWPVICVDDLASEVDRPHQRKLIGLLAATEAQLLVTGTEVPEAIGELAAPVAMFHVEHGLVTPLL